MAAEKPKWWKEIKQTFDENYRHARLSTILQMIVAVFIIVTIIFWRVLASYVGAYAVLIFIPLLILLVIPTLVLKTTKIPRKEVLAYDLYQIGADVKEYSRWKVSTKRVEISSKLRKHLKWFDIDSDDVLRELPIGWTGAINSFVKKLQSIVYKINYLTKTGRQTRKELWGEILSLSDMLHKEPIISKPLEQKVNKIDLLLKDAKEDLEITISISSRLRRLPAGVSEWWQIRGIWARFFIASVILTPLVCTIAYLISGFFGVSTRDAFTPIMALAAACILASVQLALKSGPLAPSRR